MVEIAPSILSADFANLAAQVACVEQAGARILHIDVMDGHFVPNLTLGPLVVKALRPRSRLLFDVHLMIEEPERYVEAFAAAGADYITVHWEAPKHLHRVIQQIKALGRKAGVAFNPATPVAGIEYVLPDLDLILLMTVNPGFGGQKFIPAVLPKLRSLRSQLAEWGVRRPIEVDGGIDPSTVQDAVKAGAEILVAGAAVFGQADPAVAFRELAAAARRAAGAEE